MAILDCYTFEGRLEFMSYHGPKESKIKFVLVLAPDADEWLVNSAALAISGLLVDSANIEVDESFN